MKKIPLVLIIISIVIITIQSNTINNLETENETLEEHLHYDEQYYISDTYMLKLYHNNEISELKLKHAEEINKLNPETVDQMYSDMDDLVEIIIYYYENNVDQTHPDIESWVETNYPALYDRVMSYE